VQHGPHLQTKVKSTSYPKPNADKRPLQLSPIPTQFFELYTSFGGLLFLLFEIIFWLGGGLVIGWFKYNSYETEYEMLKSMEHF